MQVKIERRRLLIIPSSELDEAYIEEVLGLKEELDEALCIRINSSHSQCYLEIRERFKA